MLRPKQLPLPPTAFGISTASDHTLLSCRVNPSNRPFRLSASRQCRQFGWKHHRVWSSYLDSDFQKHIERRHRTMMHKCAEALHRSRLRNRGQLSLQNLPHWGQRLSSFWGKSRPWWINEAKDPKGTVEDGKNNFIKVDLNLEGEELMRKFEAMRQEIEKDPYKALFGTRSLETDPRPLKHTPDHPLPRWMPPRPPNTGTTHDSNSSSKAEQKNATAKRTPQAATAPKSKPGSLGHEIDLGVLGHQSAVPKLYTSENDYEIDPITLRKVWPKKPLRHNAQASSHVADTSVDIPVKPFVAAGGGRSDVGAPNVSRPETTDPIETVNQKDTKNRDTTVETPRDTSSDQHNSPNTTKASRPLDGSRTEQVNQSHLEWLRQNGFGHLLDSRTFNHATSSFNAPGNVDDLQPRESSNEPALSCTSHEVPWGLIKAAHEPGQTPCDGKDSMAEDLDLLRSSDVRAASGIIKRPHQETALERQRRREELERDFQQEGQVHFSKPRQGEMLEKMTKRRNKTVDRIKARRRHLINEDSSNRNVNGQSVGTPETKNLENRVQDQEIMHAADAQAQEAAKQGALPATHGGDTEKGSQQEAVDLIGEGDMSANVSDFANRARWYKIKAPHADQSLTQLKPQMHTTGDQVEELCGKTTSTLRARSKPFAAAETGRQQTSEGAVVPGLEEYEARFGSSAYKFEMGSDTLKADLIKQSKDRSHTKSIEHEALPMAHRRAALLARPHAITHSGMPYSMRFMSIRLRLNEVQIKLIWVHGELETIKKDRSARLSGSQPMPAAVYKILAYDSNTGKMTTADTTSSHGRKEEALSPSSVLLRINRPTEFFPYITSMQADGYEIVSGRDDMLVFQKMRDATVSHPERSTSTELGSVSSPTQPWGISTQDHNQRTNNTTSTISPEIETTVFPPPLSHNIPPRPTTNSTTPTCASYKVTREEDVFSGSSRKWQDESNDNDSNSYSHGKKSKVRKAARRVFWVGVWTAGCTYAVGVVAEYFRTGGANGMGPQGF